MATHVRHSSEWTLLLSQYHLDEESQANQCLLRSAGVKPPDPPSPYRRWPSCLSIRIKEGDAETLFAYGQADTRNESFGVDRPACCIAARSESLPSKAPTREYNSKGAATDWYAGRKW